ncbi:MAG TPA: HepT-like ribonuclease domain-containing protein [Rhodoblastus sp.]|nr:HepT-like ribonuclease domain-containing protein [Rhodoblastus sp.]
MRRDDAIRIRHMIDAAEAVQRFVAGCRRGDLDADEMLRFALVRAVEIIGEAAAKVSGETRAERPSIPWPAIVGGAKPPDLRLFRHRPRYSLENGGRRNPGPFDVAPRHRAGHRPKSPVKPRIGQIPASFERPAPP